MTVVLKRPLFATMKTNESTTPDGKKITTTEHDSGRRDVKIEVNSLDVDMSDPRNAEAKKVIEEKILPKVGDKLLTCTLIHKPTNEHVTFIAKRKNVRDYAIKMMVEHDKQRESGNGGNPYLDHYCIVEHDVEAKEVKVSSIEP